MKSKLLTVIVLAVFLCVPLLSTESAAKGPSLGTEPSSLPGISYLYDGVLQNITASDWTTFITDVYENKTYVSYNWTQNATQDLILFDLSYTGLNSYGLDVIKALSAVGGPSLSNFTKAFTSTKNDQSQIQGYTNIQALNGGAYPGFSWSVPKVKKPEYQDIFLASIVGIVAVIFVLYFIFNRKR